MSPLEPRYPTKARPTYPKMSDSQENEPKHNFMKMKEVLKEKKIYLKKNQEKENKKIRVKLKKKTKECQEGQE